MSPAVTAGWLCGTVSSGAMSDSCPISHSKEGERSLADQGSPGVEGTPSQTLTLQQFGSWCPFQYIPGAYSYFYYGVNPFFSDLPH